MTETTPTAAVHPSTAPAGLRALMTRERWLEIVRIAGVAAVILRPDILVFLNSVKLLRVRIANVDDSGATER